MGVMIPVLRAAMAVKIKKDRRLPVDGDVVVDVDEVVSADDIVARATVSREVFSLNLIEALGLKPGEDTSPYLLKAPGEDVSGGEVIARKEGSFRQSARVCTSPIDGKLTSGPTLTGDILIAPHPTEYALPALIPGKVTGILPKRGVVIESVGSYVQCVACIGGETVGTIKVATDSPDQPLDVETVNASDNGAFLVAGTINPAALQAALVVGVQGFIVGSLTAATFEWLRQNPQPVTIVVTEGFGKLPMAMDTFELLRENAGERACIFTGEGENAAHALVELFIPGHQGVSVPPATQTSLVVGNVVRIVRGNNFGSWAKIVALPQRTQVLPSGLRTEVVRLSLEDGQEITVARNNIEIVE